MYCDFLCDHTTDVENTTWLVVNYVGDVVRNFHESPVQDFVMSMHSSTSSSGLLIQAVVTDCEKSEGEKGASNAVFLGQALLVSVCTVLSHTRIDTTMSDYD